MNLLLLPSRTLLDVTFWLGHISFALVYIHVSTNPPNMSASWYFIPSLLIGLISFVIYLLALADFVNKKGRSAITWGGLALIFSPFGIWLSYILSFKLKANNSSDNSRQHMITSNVHMQRIKAQGLDKNSNLELAKMYSPNQVAIGSFWGGPLALMYFLRKNYLALGHSTYAEKTLLYGSLFSVGLAILMLFLHDNIPDVLKIWIPFSYCFAGQYITSSKQMNNKQIEDSTEHTFHSRWKVFGIGTLTLLSYLVFLFLLVLVFNFLGIIDLAA